MRFLRKILNTPNAVEKKLIAEQCEKMKSMADEKVRVERKKEDERQKERDGICPRCGGKNIVNKISRVEGSGSVSGSLFYVSGSSSTDTNEVNNCNGCGNQWKKYKRSYKYSSDVLADWINEISIHFDGKHSYADRTVEMLKDFYAESIWKVFQEVEDDCYCSTRDDLSLSLLRKKFKSVYQ